MAQPSQDSSVTDHRYVTLILRLTLDRCGHLIQGELVDTLDTLQQRFRGSSGLNQAVEAWLRRQEQTETKP